MDPIERQLREITRESPRIADDLDELAPTMVRPHGGMDVWGEDESEDDDESDE